MFVDFGTAISRPSKKSLTGSRLYLASLASIVFSAGSFASCCNTPISCVTIAGSEWSLKDCASRSLAKVKNKGLKMTPTLAAGFESSAVRKYVATVQGAQVPTHVVTPPHEYSDVVDLGKAAVPFLLEQLVSQDELIRGVAMRALSFITNKNFARPGDFKDLDRSRSIQLQEKFAKWWEQHKNQSRVEWLIDDLSAVNFGTRRNAVDRLRDEGDVKAIPALRDSLKEKELAYYSAEALAVLGDRAAVPYLVDLYLTHEMETFRRDGICLLFKLTGQSLDYDPSASPDNRQAAIQRWKSWWQENGSEKK
jgi:hypothetical protein